MKRFVVSLFMLFVCNFAYADTETINWYVDGNVYNTTTCETGGDITLPAAPPKRGYNFTGWQVLLYDFSTLDASVNGTGSAYDASSRTYAITFDYGVVLIKVLCSTTGGTFAQTGIPDESGTGETRCCWCKATGYVPNSSDIVYENVSSSAWVFNGDTHSVGNCSAFCSSYCVDNVQSHPPFRRALFGITQ